MRNAQTSKILPGRMQKALSPQSSSDNRRVSILLNITPKIALENQTFKQHPLTPLYPPSFSSLENVRVRQEGNRWNLTVVNTWVAVSVEGDSGFRRRRARGARGVPGGGRGSQAGGRLRRRAWNTGPEGTPGGERGTGGSGAYRQTCKQSIRFQHNRTKNQKIPPFLVRVWIFFVSLQKKYTLQTKPIRYEKKFVFTDCYDD